MTDRLLRLLAAAISVSAIGTQLVSAQAPQNWPAEIYNPSQAEGLLFLPLPCGGQIAFRRVVTDSVDANSPTAPLQDREISMGRAADRSRGFIEYRRPEYLSGSLSDAATGERFYLIGAYEVTVAQYKSVMAEPDNCPPAPQRKDTVPVTDISWYDAIEFTRKLNQWIYSGSSNHLTYLAQLGVDNGFIRLPTESEWEFAARGGLAVSDAQRNEPLFFSDGSLDDYAWYNGANSSGGKIKPVGGKKPNPLGIYDIYGNAEEIVLEPFRMTRSGRLHGGIGGFVTRGGSFLDQAETLTSARRDERPFFDVQVNGEFRRRTQGFRVAVSTSSVPADLSQMSRLEAAAQEIQRQVPGAAADQPTEQLARAAAQIENHELRTQVENLNANLAAEFARRNELEALNLRASIVNASIITRELFLNIRSQAKFRDALTAANNEAEREQYKGIIRRSEDYFNMFMSAYPATLEILSSAPDNIVSAQLRSVQSDLQQQGNTELLKFTMVLSESIKIYKREGRMQPVTDRLKRLVQNDRQ